MKAKFAGLGVALVTPFTHSGSIDFEALDRLVDSVIAGGVDYIVALGTTAETPTLSHAERVDAAAAIRRRAAGRVPLVMGMGGNDTAKLCADLRAADLSGFDAVLSVTPYYNRPSQEGLFQHYRAVAQASPLPVILYNVPSRTGVNMLAQTTLRIAREVANVIGVKEACGQMDQMKALIEGAPEGFLVLSGDDGMTIPCISSGGDGVISVIANAFPAEFSEVVRTMNHDVERARGLWARLEEVCRLLFTEGNPVGVKAALAIRGVCRADVRLPLVEASEELKKAMETEICAIVK